MSKMIESCFPFSCVKYHDKNACNEPGVSVCASKIHENQGLGTLLDYNNCSLNKLDKDTK